MDERVKILTVADQFLPAYKAGGAVRTLANMTGRLGNDFAFLVLTGDRDLDETAPFPGVAADQWLDAYGCRVIYLSPGRRSLKNLRRLVKESGCHIIYLNSFFSTLTIKLVLLRRMGLLPRVPVMIAPRGEFSPGALQLKRRKKAAFIWAARVLGLYRKLTWQASSGQEAEHIRKYFQGNICIAPDLPPATTVSTPAIKSKEPGQVEVVFVSRLSRKKNVLFALHLLQRLTGRVVFDIYGPEEDPAYVDECRAVIKKLPGNVECRLCGAIPHDAVYQVFTRYHFFLFPTLGENFGHVILESLSAGCPVITSDQTPWQGLAGKKAGWDIPLEEIGQYRHVLQQCIEMDDRSYRVLSKGALDLARSFSSDDEIVRQNRELFHQVFARGRKQ